MKASEALCLLSMVVMAAVVAGAAMVAGVAICGSFVVARRAAMSVVMVGKA